MNREKAKRYVEYVVDDSGNGREWGEDRFAIVRETGDYNGTQEGYTYPSKLVCWACTNHPFPISYMVVAVHSYLDVYLSNSEVEELARDYLCEVGFFKERSFPADFVL